MICEGLIAILRCDDKNGHAGYEVSHEAKVGENAAKKNRQTPGSARFRLAGRSLLQARGEERQAL